MADSPPWLTVQTADDVVHALPLDDGIIHTFTPDCPCGPAPHATPGGLVLALASLDGREQRETP